jgi:scyllo-inositol 2-dehydrogenase (NADP+)
LPDLGSHLLDTLLFLFGGLEGIGSRGFKPWSLDRFENKSYDHFVLASEGTPLFMLEATLLSWRNSFRADVIGEKGSAHIDCLCKWGPSKLTVRKRVLPSGRPPEESSVLECADPTWKLEYEYFKELCRTGGNNLQNDIWINTTLQRITPLSG